MIKFIKFHSSTFLLFLFSFLILSSSAQAMMEEDDTPYTIGQRGLTLYEEGKYKEAAPLLHKALEDGQITFALPYADICLRNLDKGKHHPGEAALWYVRAGASGDGDALAYLRSLSEALIGESSEEDKIKQLIHVWAHQDANKGYTLYIEGNFADASKPLKRASLGNHCLAQELYGDICLRKLDGKPHPYLEAAMWYLLSARGGDSQTLSYLKSIVPEVLITNDYESEMKAIVGCWVMHETLPQLTLLSPGKVNNFLIMEYDRKINKTIAQKLPYLFERIASAIMFNLTGRVHSVMKDQLFPQADTLESSPESRSCALSARTLQESKFIKPPLVACAHGPVYMKYFKSLDDKLEGGFLRKPKEKPKISPIYEFLLAALEDSTKGKTARDLSSISHHDYPWLWAGINFWKEKKKQPFDFTSLPEEELLKKLTELSEPLSEQDIKAILLQVEKEEIWPNDETHPVCKQFNQRMRVYFISSLSRKESIVKETESKFYEKLKAHDLDCSHEKARELLKTPMLMFYCHNLKLRNVSSNQACYNALEESQRYFINLKLEIFFSSNFQNHSAWGKKIHKLLDKIEKRGIQITRGKVAIDTQK